MKTRNRLMILVLTGIFAVCLSCAWPLKRGNGIMMSSEKPVSAFETVEVSGMAVVNYYKSQEYRAVVTVDSNLDKYVKVNTEGAVLKIGTERGGNYFFTQYIVDVYAPSLHGISISGSVHFNAKDKITVSTFRSDISGSGKITGTFECDNFITKISGSGVLTLTGSCSTLDISVSGSGNFSGNEFETKNAHIHISGSGKMDVWVLEYLSAEISGSGRVRYRGDPKIDYSVSGSGRLERS